MLHCMIIGLIERIQRADQFANLDPIHSMGVSGSQPLRESEAGGWRRKARDKVGHVAAEKYYPADYLSRRSVFDATLMLACRTYPFGS
jgi:hypothetical protein